MDASAESTFEELKRYVRFSEADARLLTAFCHEARPHFERIAGEFYERIREHEAAHAVFSGEEQILRLRRSLVGWLERLCSGAYGEEYSLATARIGRVHVEVGLPQRYVLTAMALIRDDLLKLADETMGDDAPSVRSAVGRLLDLELAMMLEAYQEHLMARFKRFESTERRALGRALERSEHRYRNAVELARLLVIGLDGAGVIHLFNREAERITGFARDEVFGHSFSEALLPQALREEHGPIITDAALGRLPAENVLESVIRLRSGKAREVRWSFAYAPSEGETDDDDDVVLFVLGLDITEEGAMNERIRQTEKLAAVGTLAAGLAHEIRNPLNGAKLHVTFLERALRHANVDSETREAVTVVSDELTRLSNLVSEFLSFARPQPLVKKATSARKLCKRVALLATKVAEPLGVTLVLDLPRSELLLQLDADRMEQVLLNLLQNAIESLSPTGGGKVILRVRRLPRHGVIEVEDEGPGLPAPDAPIFDAFYSTKANGTGLGLAIVHRIVTDHGGTIDVDSRPGRTKMTVTLPIPIT